MRRSIVMLALAAGMLLSLPACNKTERFGTDIHPKKAPDAPIEIIYDGIVRRPHLKLGYVEKQNRNEPGKHDEAMAQMKNEARRLGADALILDQGERSADARNYAVAIKYLD